MPYFIRLLPFFLLLWVLIQPVALLANGPQPLSEKEVTQLAAFLKHNWRTPEQYVIEKFKDHDIILMAEDHRIKHNLHLAHKLIPLLYRAGVYNFGMEFGASEDQAALDKLVTAEKYDEGQARRLMFHYNVGWAFKEYLDVYRAAWELNRTLPAGARKFRILNLSYCYDWSEATVVRTPENTKKVFYKGGTEWYRADVIKREILEKKEKILVLTGTPHAFTRYQMPVFDYNARQFYSFENRLLGNLLYKQAPKKVFTILLHQISFCHKSCDGQKEKGKLTGRKEGEEVKQMVTIKITIEDEAGKQIGEPQAYALEIGNGTLAEIETAVEKLKRKSLPEIEHQLLAHDQAELVKKKVN